jgi:hypothetical protein
MYKMIQDQKKDSLIVRPSPLAWGAVIIFAVILFFGPWTFTGWGDIIAPSLLIGFSVLWLLCFEIRVTSTELWYRSLFRGKVLVPLNQIEWAKFRYSSTRLEARPSMHLDVKIIGKSELLHINAHVGIFSQKDLNTLKARLSVK